LSYSLVALRIAATLAIQPPPSCWVKSPKIWRLITFQ